MSLLPRGRGCNAKRWELMARQPPWRGGRAQRARQTHEREGAWEVRCRPTSTGRLRLGQERGPRCVEAAGGLHDDDGGFGKFADECRTTGGAADAKEGLVLKGGRGGYKRGERAKGSRGKVHVTTGRSFPIPCPALPCSAACAGHGMPSMPLVVRSLLVRPPGLSCLVHMPARRVHHPREPRRGEGDGGPSLCAIIPPLGPPPPL
ncbi:hypothetical protein COCVIDRAFT_16865 [Bipolaris victoriae FI3]|uniref:Uncharacterized protein n=1 Tax=Bipolaris victoriae (strain FI3) TaxID=930091 RepID=W7EGY3_BIPV3|nr:hypothetical protein COCVIDRAFT_16865 [Bipolaris victoriae FI3]